MTRSLESSAFWTGVVDVLPFIVMVVPFATLFGVVAIEAGLSLAQTLSFSILVIGRLAICRAAIDARQCRHWIHSRCRFGG